MPNQVDGDPLDSLLQRSSASSVDALLLGPEVKKIAADPDLFCDESTVEVLEVRANCTKLLPRFSNDTLATYLSNVARETASSVRGRVIFIEGEKYPSNKLCCTADLFSRLCETFSITPRFISCLPRQQMPGAHVVHDPESGQPVRHEMWYSLIERFHDPNLDAFRSPAKTEPPSRYNVSKSVARWSRMNVWAGYDLHTDTSTVLVLRCPTALKDHFVNTLGGDHGSLLLRYPTLSHALLCNDWLSQTYDHLAKLAMSLYRLETSNYSLADATIRSQQFLQINREVSQVATDYKILRESLTVIRDQHLELKNLLKGFPALDVDGVRVGGSFSFNDVLFDQFLAQLDLIKVYSDLYVQRAVIGMNESFALANQRDADLNIEVAKAMYSDGRALQSIQYLTMTFLAPSLAASIFGMGFFSTDIDNDGHVVLSISGKWWMFLAVLGFLASAMGVTMLYLRKHRRKYSPLAAVDHVGEKV